MSWLATVRQRIQDFDRERVQSFARFLWTRFVDDRCFESAGALAYTTMFALVPLSMVVFGVLAAFPVFDTWTLKMTDFIFSNFVPSSARVVESYLREFAQTSRQLTVTGVVALLVSLLLTMWSIELSFNRVWRVPSPRPKLVRFLMYWTLLTLGSLLATAAFAVSSYLFSFAARAGSDALTLGDWLLHQLPVAVAFTTFTAAYWLIPHRTVPLRFAVAGGLFATLLFEIAKRGFATYLLEVTTYTQLYGAIAVIPIFMVWLYLSWVVVLLGASFAASLSSFRYQPAAQRLPSGMEFYGLLRLLTRLNAVRDSGETLHLHDIQLLEPSLTDDLLQRLLSGLADLRIVQRAENGGWLLSRDLDAVTLGELHEGLSLRIPVHEPPLPGREDTVGQCALRCLAHLRTPLQDPLAAAVGPFLQVPTPTQEVDA